ncbi:MAG TPA: MMPL family transporter [Solirubrobacteraceae bacterium]|nr:MMPL family transporter [Solirubrobacteraceae bacterium]
MVALARTIHRRRRLVLAVTLVVVAAAGVFGGPVVGLLDSDDDFEDPRSESVLARDTVERVTGRSASPDMVVLVRLGAPVESRAARAKIARVAAALEDPDVAQVVAVRRGQPAELVSRDRRSTYLLATFAAGADEDELAERLQVQVEREPGVTAGGGQLAFTQVGEQVQEDLARAELLAFPLLFVLSLVVFRGAVAALLPVVVGATTILLTFALLRIANSVEPMSVFAINLITGAGLGLAIDYSLFVVSRFREELEGGSGTAAALAATMRTAGRTVLFSAVTVAAAMAALIAFDLRFLFSMGVGGTLVALCAALVSLTVLPALLAVLGPRVNALSLKRWQVAMHRDAAHVRAGPWYRFTQTVMRRPGPIAAATAALLIAMGLPFLRIDFTGVDAGVLPTERSARVVEDALEAEFPRGPTTPVIVLAGAGERGRAAATGYARDLSQLDGVASVSEPEQAGGYWRIDVVPEDDELSASAKRLVEDIRGSPEPFPVQVTGGTAGFLDQQASLGDSLPLGLILLASSTLVILFLMTGSVVLPVKALIMNLLTLSAAFGLLVLIFQDGRLEGLLAFEAQGALESTQPILLFAVAFGLSTDYGVFLLTRIKEARDAGASDREAVAVGLERTGRIVTYAALLFCIAIGAFATSEVVFIKELGVGTALAVLIDAFLVRALLVPSLMALLGRWNWWAPAPLARLNARFGVREAT